MASDGQHLQIIVHQISASDLALCTTSAACAKPLYSHYAEVCEQLLIKSSKDSAESGVTLLTADPLTAHGLPTPLGMKFSTPLAASSDSVVLRDEVPPATSTPGSTVSITGLLFPVAAVLIPSWIIEVQSRYEARQIADGGAPPRRILYLISGPSTQAGPENEAVGSSDGIALLLTRFMR